MSKKETFQLAATLAAALSLSMLPQAARAYTAEQQQYCSGDAMRLCASEIPNIDRITACMVRNKSQLSPECRRVFVPPGASGPEEPATAKPTSLHKFRSYRPRRPQSADAS